MEQYPGVGRYTNAYLDACRDFFFQILKKDPFFVGKTWITAFFKTLKQAFLYELTDRKRDDWYFYGTAYNVHNIFLPAALSAGGYLGAVIRWKQSVWEKQSVLWAFCCILVILSGTVQAVFMVPALRYFLPSCAGIGFCFLS